MPNNFSFNDYLVIDTTGSIGVGSTNPIARFYVTGSSTVTNQSTAVIRGGTSVQTSGVGLFDVQNSSGTTILFVSGSGRVGIGTVTSPINNSKLEVNGSVVPSGHLGSTSNLGEPSRYWGIAYANEMYAYNGGTNSVTMAGNTFQVYSQTSPAAYSIYVDSNNRVGIGAASISTARLLISGTTTGSDSTLLVKHGVANGSNLPVVNIQNSAGTSLFFVSGSGNVGVGTTPGRKLDVNGVIRSIGTTGVSSPTLELLSLGAWTWGIRGDGQGLVFLNDNSERMRLLAAGTLGVTGSIEPGGDNQYNLGSLTKRWNTLFATNISGSLTPTGATAGSVFFAGTSGQIQQDNANFFWDDTNNRLGIGTATPSTKLHLWEPSASDAIFRITPGNTPTEYDGLIQITGQTNDIALEGFEIWYKNNTGDVRIATTYNSDQAAIRFHTRTASSKSTSNERLTIYGNGNVGIGSVTPTAKLFVQGSTTTSTPTLIVKENQAMANATAAFEVQNSAGSSLLFVSGSGNVGIGTSSPNQTLEVQNGTTYQVRLGNGTGNSAWTYDIGRSPSSGLLIFYGNQNSANGYIFGGVNGDRLRIDPGGNVGIGAGTNLTAKLLVTGSGTGTGATAHFVNSSGTSLFFVRDDGRVGVGSSSPGANLDVNGTFKTFSGTSYEVLRHGSFTLNDGTLGNSVHFATIGTTNSRAVSIELLLTEDNIGHSVMRYQIITNWDEFNIATKRVVLPLYSNNPRYENSSGLYGGAAHELQIWSSVAGELNIRLVVKVIGSNVSPTWYWTARLKNCDITATPNSTAVDSTAYPVFADSQITQRNLGVGIGTTNTYGYKLAVNGNTSITGSALPGDNGASYDLGSTAFRWRTLHAVNISGSLTPTGATVGSVFFAGTSGQIQQDNANFFWDDTNNRLGIGTATPGATLDVAGTIQVTTSIVPLWAVATNGSLLFREFGSTAANNTLELNVRPSSGKSGYVTFTENAVADRWSVGIANGNGNLRFISGTPTAGSLRASLESTGNWLPGADNSQNLGSSVLRWNTLHATNISGSLTPTGATAGSVFFAGAAGQIQQDNSKLFWDNSNKRLGVGNSAPAHPLDVTGTSRYTGIAYYDGGESINLYGIRGRFMGEAMHLYNKVAIGYPFGWGGDVSTTPIYGLSTYGGAILAYNQGTVSIGTTATTARLIVSGSSTTTTPTMIVREGVVSPSGGALAFEVEKSSGATLFAVSGSGNVGIGTSIPNATFEVVGVSGSLFSITDNLSGSLFSVNTISGLPILEVFSDNTLIAGAYNSNALVVTGSSVGVGTRNPTSKLHVSAGDLRFDSNSYGIVYTTGATANNVLKHDGTRFVPGTVAYSEISSTPTIGNATLTVGVSGTGLSISASPTFTANATSNNTITITSNATSANTAGAIVARDGSGDFSANIINAATGFRIAGAATPAGRYLRADGTNFVSSAIVANDVPVLNQNTTGQAGSVANSVTFNSSGGAAAGTSFNGSSPVTVSFATVGAPSTTGTNATGTWGISISGNAATATSATTAGSVSNSITFNSSGTGASSPATFNGGTGVTISYNTIGAQAALTNPITGTGTSGFVARFNGATSLTNSVIQDDGTRVGVGTTGTSTRMSVYGTSTGTDTTLLVRHQVANGSNLPVLDVQNSSNASLLFVSGSGNVGIGTTTNLTSKLQLFGTGDLYTTMQSSGNSNVGYYIYSNTTTNVGTFLYNTSSGTFQAGSATNNKYQLIAATNPVLTVDTTQNVGIGTSSPSTKLHVHISSNNDGLFLGDGTRQLRISPNMSANSYNEIVEANDYALIFSGSKASLGSNGFVVAPWDNTAVITSGLRMNASGNIGIGTTAPGVPLDVNGKTRLRDDVGIDAGKYLYLGREESFGGSDTGGSDYGYITWNNDDNTYNYWGDSGENGALIIGSQNDGTNGNSDVVVLKGLAANIFDTPNLFNLFPGNNRVGIGTTNPAYKLVVHAGDALINDITVGRGGPSPGSSAIPSNNTAVGNGSLLSLTSAGTYNTATGHTALYYLTNASENTAFGYAALQGSNGNYNTAVGSQALQAVSTATGNVAVGYKAATAATVTGVTAIGSEAMYANTSGNYNTAVGYRALKDNITNSDNAAFGYLAATLTKADGITAIGSNALAGANSGNYNTAIGNYALYKTAKFEGNTALGYYAGYNYTDGQYNTHLGYNSGIYGTTGIYNTAAGSETLENVGSGNYNVALGYRSLRAAFSNYNVGLGYQAGVQITSGGSNVVIGGYAASSPFNTQSNNIFIADGAGNLRMLITGSNGNVGIGITTPGARLDIVGGSTSSPVFPSLRLRQSVNNGYAYIQFGDSTTNGNNWHIGNDTDASIRFYNGAFGSGTERMRITSTGDVGIGLTTAPGVRLDIGVGAANTAQVRVTSSGADSAISLKNTATSGREWWIDSGGQSAGIGAGNFGIYDFTAGATRFVISSVGAVGMGITNPDAYARLHLAGAAWFGGTNNTSHFNYTSLFDSSEDTYIRGGKTAAKVVIGDSSGDVGIGTATTSSKIHLHGTVTYTNRPTPGSGTALVLNGDQVRAQTSSKRDKNSITPYTKSLEDILKLKPVNYRYNFDYYKPCAGFIAEDFSDLGLEEFIIRDIVGDPCAISYGEITALLTNGIKELKAENDSLKSEIQSLKEQISSILAVLNNK